MTQAISGGDIIVKVLADEGVDTIFGYSGGAILPTYDAIFRYNETCEKNGGQPIQLIVPASEQGAGFMAAGYARSTGKVGVFLVTSGPGATNSVTPVRDCMADSVPVVLITGQVPRGALGSDAFQEAPVFTMMSTCAKHAFLVTDPEELEATVRTAFEIARSGRPGPVVVDIPKDVQNWMGLYKGAGTLTLRGYDRRVREIQNSRVTPEHAKAFFDLAGRERAPAALRGWRRDQRGRGRRVEEVFDEIRHSRNDHLDGIGCDGQRRSAFAPHARNAWRGVRQLCRRGLRFHYRCRVAIRRPRGREAQRIGSECARNRTYRHRFCGTRKSESRNLGAHRRREGGARGFAGRRSGFSKDFSKWQAHLDAMKKDHPHNYDRASD